MHHWVTIERASDDRQTLATTEASGNMALNGQATPRANAGVARILPCIATAIALDFCGEPRSRLHGTATERAR